MQNYIYEGQNQCLDYDEEQNRNTESGCYKQKP